MSHLQLNICTNLSAVEPSFTGRKLYDSDATDKEFGQKFFPEGSQRVYVRCSISEGLSTLTDIVHQGLLGKIPDQVVKIASLPVWQGINERFLR